MSYDIFDSGGINIVEYVKKNTEDDQIFIVPPNFGSFRLVAKRAIVVDRKCILFSDEGMLKWWERINDCYDLIEEIASVPMRRLYQEHGASTGRIGEIRLYDSTNIFLEKIQNSKEGLTACVVLQGTPTLEYKNNGMHVPVELTEGNIFIWDSSVQVGFDDMKDARIVVYGIK